MSGIQICEDQVEQMKKMLRGRVIDLRVILDDDRIVLLGTSTTYYGKQLAQHTALKSLGITNLVNEIEVRPAASTS
jgi:hypothetical protein